MSSARGSMRFIETLGQGGFGTVYLVDIETAAGFMQRRAVKILSTEMTAVADVAARQRDEARLLAQLNHDHIVKVFDLIELGGRPAVMMEYVEGADAQQILREGPMPPRAATQLIAAAAAALEAAYEAPSPRTGQPLCVIHRDIKPANLLVSRHGGVKVLDFGIARAEFDREGKTSSVMYGTARYMPPEQWLYNQTSPALDIYALGISYLEALTAQPYARPPLMPEAYADHLAEMLQRLPSPWRRQVKPLLEQMLAYDPADRPAAAAAHDQLLALAERAPGDSLARLARRCVPPLIKARRQKFAEQPLPAPITFAQPTLTSPAPPKQPTAPPEQHTTPPKRSRLLLTGAGLVGLVIMFGIGGVSAGIYATFIQPAAEVASLQVPDPEPAPPPSEDPPDPVTAPVEAPTEAPDVAPDEAPSGGSSGSSKSSKGSSEASSGSSKSSKGSSGSEGSGGEGGAAPVWPPPAPAPKPKPKPTPKPEEAPDIAAVEVETRPITIIGPDFGAKVYVDGRYVGGSPVNGASLTYGRHDVLVRSQQFGELRHQIEVGETTSGTYTWRSGTDYLAGN